MARPFRLGAFSVAKIEDRVNVIKVDDAGLIKLNSLATGKLDIPASGGIFKKNEVPYNKLLDRGYKSVADWHSTKPIAEGEDESAGRWKG